MTLLAVVDAVLSAPLEPDHTAALVVDPLLCPTCGGDGAPTLADIHIAAQLGDVAPTVCRRCRGTGRRNCERCGVRAWTRTSLGADAFLCELCDLDTRADDPCAVCGATDAEGHRLLHYPCGQVFCSTECGVDARHTCHIDRTVE